MGPPTCYYFTKGSCRNGSRCPFHHDDKTFAAEKAIRPRAPSRPRPKAKAIAAVAISLNETLLLQKTVTDSEQETALCLQQETVKQEATESCIAKVPVIAGNSVTKKKKNKKKKKRVRFDKD